MDKYAKKFARRHNLPLIRIMPSAHQYVRAGKTIYMPDLGEWISYIKNAKYFITDSFHGTAFAVTLGTQFINISPGLTATRNLSLLELTKLESRMLKRYDVYSVVDDQIDFVPVHKILQEEREKSIVMVI